MKLLPAILLPLLALLLAACGHDTAPATSTAAATTRPRIISTVPAATLNLVLIGAADKLVGVTQWDAPYLPITQKNLPVVGDYESMNYEQLIKLKPTTLIIQTTPARITDRLKDFVASQHIELVNMHFESIDDIWSSVRVLGKAADCEKDAERAVTDAQAELKKVADHYKNAPHPKVVCLMNHSMLAGGKTFFDEMITAAGAENVGTKVGDGYPETTKETVVKLAPEVLILCSSEEVDNGQQLKPWHELSIPAAKSGRIYLTTDKTSLLPSIDVGKNVEALAALIHQGDPPASGGKP